MKNLANIITSFRFVFAVGMLLTIPFSTAFWFCYLGGGLSDLLDGWIARKLNQQSEAGAKLDSIADLFFAAVLTIFVVKNVKIRLLIWLWIGGIALIRLITYGIGLYKYHTFSALHTYLNKVTGGAIFLFPLFYTILGAYLTEVLLCLVASISTVEEMIITVNSKQLNRDQKGLFLK